MKIRKELKKGTISLCLLYLLSLKDFYGYELIYEINKTIDVPKSTIYPSLKRLHKQNFLQVLESPSEVGPKRKYYSLTKEGEEYLDVLINEYFDLTKNINFILSLKRCDYE